MSSTPDVWWSLSLPSPAATRPSTTIGLCQWASPIGSRPTSFPVVGDVHGDRVAPLHVQQPAGDDGARAAGRVRPDLVEPAAPEPPGGRAVGGREEHPRALPGRGLGEEVGRPRHLHGLQLAARLRVHAREPRELEQPEQAVLAALHEVAAGEQRRGGRAEVEIVPVQLGLVRGRPVLQEPLGVGREDERRCRPRTSCRRRARCRLRRAGRRWPDRPRAPSAPRSRSPTRDRSRAGSARAGPSRASSRPRRSCRSPDSA